MIRNWSPLVASDNKNDRNRKKSWVMGSWLIINNPQNYSLYRAKMEILILEGWISIFVSENKRWDYPRENIKSDFPRQTNVKGVKGNGVWWIKLSLVISSFIEANLANLGMTTSLILLAIVEKNEIKVLF